MRLAYLHQIQQLFGKKKQTYDFPIKILYNKKKPTNNSQ